MQIIIKIPKKEKPSKKSIKKELDINMEIIENKVNKTISIKFSGGIPSEIIRTELKRHGWIWNPKQVVWQPKNQFGFTNNIEFAKKLYKEFFTK